MVNNRIKIIRRMKQKFRITESELKAMVLETVENLLQQESDSPGIRFTLDDMSRWTLENDSDNRLDESNNWIKKIKNWDVNDYSRYYDIINKTPRHLKGFLSYHSPEEIKNGNWLVYTLKGHDVCFALHYIEDGQIDICNVCNNSDLRGIGRDVVEFARHEGGTQLDHFMGEHGDPGKLGRLYHSAGLDRQTWFDHFNPDFQPDDDEWKLDTERFGHPDVEGLESSKHRMRYNNPKRGYKQKFDKRMKEKFGIDNGITPDTTLP